ncbi:DoxX family protein [Nocardia sp. NPDC004722]
MLMRRVARPLLAAPFVVDGITACTDPGPRLKAADALVQQGRRRLPDSAASKLTVDPETVVRVNGAAQVLAGALLAFGKAPRAAAFVLAVTVIPTAVTEQDFWAEPDPDRKAAKRIAFLKDAGLLGGLLIASGDTEGRPSLGWRGRRAAKRAAATVSAALPIATQSASSEVLRERAHDAMEQVRALSSTAAAKGAELAETAQVRGGELAETARGHAADFAETAKDHAAELSGTAKELSGTAKEHAAEITGTAKEHAGDIAESVKRNGGEWAGLIRRRVADKFEDR